MTIFGPSTIDAQIRFLKDDNAEIIFAGILSEESGSDLIQSLTVEDFINALSEILG